MASDEQQYVQDEHLDTGWGDAMNRLLDNCEENQLTIEEVGLLWVIGFKAVEGARLASHAAATIARGECELERAQSRRYIAELERKLKAGAKAQVPHVALPRG
jgi:hypothetical protein